MARNRYRDRPKSTASAHWCDTAKSEQRKLRKDGLRCPGCRSAELAPSIPEGRRCSAGAAGASCRWTNGFACGQSGGLSTESDVTSTRPTATGRQSPGHGGSGTNERRRSADHPNAADRPGTGADQTRQAAPGVAARNAKWTGRRSERSGDQGDDGGDSSRAAVQPAPPPDKDNCAPVGARDKGRKLIDGPEKLK